MFCKALCLSLCLVAFSGMLQPSVGFPANDRQSRSTSPMLAKVNVDTYLRNTKAVNMQIKCVLKDGPCDGVGKEIKRLIPLVMHDTALCKQCSETEIEKIQKIIKHMKNNYPTEWEQGKKKFGAPEDI